MYSYIKGRLVEAREGAVVLENNGIGYEIGVSGNTLSDAAAVGTDGEMKLYTYLYVREDTFALYGFSRYEERTLFMRLIDISGVGPKAALAILSSATPESLAMAIVTGDEKTLTAAPGIGKKIAQRIILELKDKMAGASGGTLDFSSGGGTVNVSAFTSKATEAAQALAVLGYTSAEVAAALKGIDVESLPLEEIVRQSLKKMVK